MKIIEPNIEAVRGQPPDDRGSDPPTPPRDKSDATRVRLLLLVHNECGFFIIGVLRLSRHRIAPFKILLKGIRLAI
jgi:hypothetical protein